jgi:hypothetical protein
VTDDCSEVLVTTLENLKGRDHLGDLQVVMMIVLRCMCLREAEYEVVG